MLLWRQFLHVYNRLILVSNDWAGIWNLTHLLLRLWPVSQGKQTQSFYNVPWRSFFCSPTPGKNQSPECFIAKKHSQEAVYGTHSVSCVRAVFQLTVSHGMYIFSPANRRPLLLAQLSISIPFYIPLTRTHTNTVTLITWLETSTAASQSGRHYQLLKVRKSPPARTNLSTQLLKSAAEASIMNQYIDCYSGQANVLKLKTLKGE